MFGSNRSIVATLLCSFALAVSARALSVSEITDISPKVDEVPAPIRTPAPEYPAALRESKVSGIVSVVLVVDEAGEVIAAEIGKSTHDEFNAPALAAIRHWKFKPAKLAGNAVKVKVTIPVRFSA